MDNLRDKAIDIKGKKYVLVSDRVLYFNETNPQGSIITEVLSPLEAQTVVMKATVFPDSASSRQFTGYSQATWGDGYINKTSALENAETSAVGRALAFMGIGVLESIASADEIRKTETTAAKRFEQPKENGISQMIREDGTTSRYTPRSAAPAVDHRPAQGTDALRPGELPAGVRRGPGEKRKPGRPPIATRPLFTEPVYDEIKKPLFTEEEMNPAPLSVMGGIMTAEKKLEITDADVGLPEKDRELTAEEVTKAGEYIKELKKPPYNLDHESLIAYIRTETGLKPDQRFTALTFEKWMRVFQKLETARGLGDPRALQILIGAPVKVA